MQHTQIKGVLTKAYSALLQEIGTVCARALERQTRHTQLQQRSIATVLLDEGGLPGVRHVIASTHFLWQT